MQLPFVPVWITAHLLPFGSFWVYVASQLFVLLGFWSVWTLGSRFLSPWTALAASLMLIEMQYYNIAAINFNDDVILLGLWPFLALFFYDALQFQKLKSWMGVGVVSGLAMMTNTVTLAMILPMFLLMLSDVHCRKQFSRPGPYVAFFIGLLICFPHLYWLFHQAWLSPGVSSGSVASFLQDQLSTFAGAFLLLILLFVGSREAILPHEQAALQLSRFTKRFLIFVGLLPFLSILLVSWLFHKKLEGEMGMALWGLSLSVLSWKQPIFSLKRMRRFLAATAAVMFLMWIGCYTSYFHPGQRFDASYPAKDISAKAAALWSYPGAPSLVGANSADDHLIAGYIAVDMTPHPMVLENWRGENAAILKRTGGLFVTEESSFPASIGETFPSFKVLPRVEFNRHPDHHGRYVKHVLFGVVAPG
jgi:4-amino-4-deoxy-L-arabinose transferase-like glycosyltransferase